MKNLLANSRCGYSSVTSFYPKLAALSVSKTATTLVVAGASFAFTKSFEVLPNNIGLREETLTQISGLHHELIDLSNQLDKEADEKKKLQSSLESLTAEKKVLEASLELLQARVASVELIKARVEKLETASWFGWFKKTRGYHK